MSLPPPHQSIKIFLRMPISPEESILLDVPLGSRVIDVILDKMVEDIKRLKAQINTGDANDAISSLTEINLRVFP